jgi:hypothetical protein
MCAHSSGIAPVHPGHRRGISAAASGTLRISHKFVAAAAAAATSAVSTPTGAAANAAHSFSCESPYNRSVLTIVLKCLCIELKCCGSCCALRRARCVLAERAAVIAITAVRMLRGKVLYTSHSESALHR